MKLKKQIFSSEKIRNLDNLFMITLTHSSERIFNPMRYTSFKFKNNVGTKFIIHALKSLVFNHKLNFRKYEIKFFSVFYVIKRKVISLEKKYTEKDSFKLIVDYPRKLSLEID